MIFNTSFIKHNLRNKPIVQRRWNHTVYFGPGTIISTVPKIMKLIRDSIKPFYANSVFLHSLRKSEDLWFSDILGGKEETIDMKWVKETKSFAVFDNKMKQRTTYISI